MPKVILGMTMSLDGFVNDNKGSIEHLFPDLEALQGSEMMKQSIRDTGAVNLCRLLFYHFKHLLL